MLPYDSAHSVGADSISAREAPQTKAGARLQQAPALWVEILKVFRQAFFQKGRKSLVNQSTMMLLPVISSGTGRPI